MCLAIGNRGWGLEFWGRIIDSSLFVWWKWRLVKVGTWTWVETWEGESPIKKSWDRVVIWVETWVNYKKTFLPIMKVRKIKSYKDNFVNLIKFLSNFLSIFIIYQTRTWYIYFQNLNSSLNYSLLISISICQTPPKSSIQLTLLVEYLL